MPDTASRDGERTYSITEVEQVSGLAAHTLRWYEELGLIKNVDRGPGGRRVYSERHLLWLEFVAGLRETGMSVADMTRYVSLARQGQKTASARRRMVELHRDQVRQQMEGLTKTLRYLEWTISTYEQAEEGGPDIFPASIAV
jgi:DNA-binding transcriptional MerR regulator